MPPPSLPEASRSAKSLSKNPAKALPPRPARRPSATPPAPAPETVDSRYLEGLIGYNARRAALAVIGVFLERMEPFELRPVDFSILSLIHHNPGITARQLCHTLGIRPPNMVGMISGFEQRGLIERQPHPRDRRAQGLHLRAEGRTLMESAELTAVALEKEVAHRLSPQEQATLMALLQKIYL